MKKLYIILISLLACLNISAQLPDIVKEPADAPDDGKKHAMTIYLKNQEVIEYKDVTKIDHVTYLPGIGMKVYQVGQEESVDYLYSQMEKIAYTPDENANANWKLDGIKEAMWTDYPEAWRLEYPQLHKENISATPTAENSQIIVKRTDDFGITFSLEWDNSKIANRWTCYQMHAGNTMAAVKRKDDFKHDNEAIVSSELEDYKGTDFDRGHLCPSADRLCSTEQNKQTFLLTNMQPQYHAHNGGLWGRLEDEVRNFATDPTYTNLFCDTLYVVKAATITDKVTINGEDVDGIYPDIKCGKVGTAVNQLLVPKYFYMALLHYNKETDGYHALAFWTEHKNETQPLVLGDYAISIKELQERTGIDFFCNLPDDIEEKVEESLDLNFWHLKKSSQ